MRYVYIILFGFIAFGSAFSQFKDSDNELHAIFIQKPKTQSNYIDGSVFTNVNISGNSFPQNEPSVKISRVDPDIVVAAWRDFRLGVTPSVRRIGYSYSTDGGVTWSVSQLLPDPNPNHTTQSDPVIACDSSGYFYISSTSRQPVSGFNREMIVYRSTDNGQTFAYFTTAVPGSGEAGEDKEWIFNDPVLTNPTYNNLFISWTSFGPSTGIKFRKSMNAGVNWSSTVDVSDNGNGQGSNICSGVNGEIYIVWRFSGVQFDRSTNGGSSFGTDKEISSFSFNSNDSYPFICVDYSNGPRRGNVYVSFTDSRNGTDDVWLQRSTNGGSNWLAAPIRINDFVSSDQFWPNIKCDENGDLYVLYYDSRSGLNSYIARSTDGGDTWDNQRLSDMSFSGNVPNSDVRFGDYIDIDVHDGRVNAVWTDDRVSNNQEIYTAIVDFTTSVVNNGTSIPKGFKLEQNFPNPFNPETTIKFDIPSSQNVKLIVYNSLGEEVSSLVNGVLKAGSYSVNWDGSDSPSGVYFYELIAGDYRSVKKMALLK